MSRRQRETLRPPGFARDSGAEEYARGQHGCKTSDRRVWCRTKFEQNSNKYFMQLYSGCHLRTTIRLLYTHVSYFSTSSSTSAFDTLTLAKTTAETMLLNAIELAVTNVIEFTWILLAAVQTTGRMDATLTAVTGTMDK